MIFASQITCKKRQNFAKNSSSSCASFAVQPVLKPKYEKSFTPNPLFGSKIREHIYVWNGWLDLGKKFKTSARNQSDARNINPLSDDLRNYLRQRKVLKDTHYVTSNTQRTLRINHRDSLVFAPQFYWYRHQILWIVVNTLLLELYTHLCTYLRK